MMAKRYTDAEELLKYKEREVVEAHKNNTTIRYVIDTKYIEQMSAADVVERKRGEWIYKQIALRKYSVTCPFCGLEYTDNYDGYVDVGSFNFCPNCGADMREDGHDD